PLISYHIQVFLLIDWHLIYGSKKVGYLVHQYKYPLSLFSSSCSLGSFSFTRKDRKSTRLNSSHVSNSYAVFCLKKKSRGLSAPSISQFAPLGKYLSGSVWLKYS